MATGSAYGEASFAGFCRWEHRPKDLIKNSVLYDVPYFGATPVYSNVRTEDVITEALTNLYVEWNFNRGTMNKSKVDSAKLQRVQLELSIHCIKIRTTGGSVQLDPKRIEFCDISDTQKQKSTERFLTLVANEDQHNAAYVFLCDATVATKIKRSVLQLFDMCVMNDLTEKRKQNGESAAASSSRQPLRPTIPPQQSEDGETSVHSLVEEFGLKFRSALKQAEQEQQAEADARVVRVDALRTALVAEEDAKKRAELGDELMGEVRRFAQSMSALLINAKTEVSNVEEEMKKKADEIARSSAGSPHYERPGEKADWKAALLRSKQEDQRLAEIFGALEPPTVRAPPVPKRPAAEGVPPSPLKPVASTPIPPPSRTSPPASANFGPPSENPFPLRQLPPRRTSVKDKVIAPADPFFSGAQTADSPHQTTVVPRPRAANLPETPLFTP